MENGEWRITKDIGKMSLLDLLGKDGSKEKENEKANLTNTNTQTYYIIPPITTLVPASPTTLTLLPSNTCCRT